ncbi:Uncharacterized protein ANR2 [Candida viswanathii]|uniref:Uncharacterized protein ANR2 n=1 Tax=Candida viswanathii TaxID=5486 RepID=A0A367XNG5_9ASCO|nr:Uncharacterized protein ANR2 [Candida viswanathii]
MSYQSSNIIGVFLAEFDVKSGYKLVWTKSLIDGFGFEGLDYKAFPSGIHEFNNSTVLLSHSFHDKLYYGLSKFYQYIIGGDSKDRSNVKMYALGVLCAPRPNNWKPNEFINNGWEYVDLLNEKLVQFVNLLEYTNFKPIEAVFERASSLTPTSPSIDNHLLTNLPEMFRTLGPLVFVLYKQSLLRKSILIFNEHNKTYDDQDILPNGTDHLYNVSSYCYLLSLLSLIPQDIDLISKTSTATYSQPVYHIGLNDLTGDLLKIKGYIGSTNDEILKDNHVFDVGVVLDDKTRVFSYPSQTLKATNKDYRKFQLIYQDLPAKKIRFSNHSNISTDDLNSLRTASFRDYSELNLRTDIEEPSWWKESAIEPVSWTESIWSAFSWFATAGQQLETPPVTSPPIRHVRTEADLLDLINIVGYFHKLTKKWFYIINEMVLEVLDDQAITEEQPLTERITIKLTYQDVLEMELDPYSAEDLTFIKEFILLYWEIVDNVEVGVGLTNICC